MDFYYDQTSTERERLKLARAVAGSQVRQTSQLGETVKI